MPDVNHIPCSISSVTQLLQLLQAELEVRSLHFTATGAKKLFKFTVGQVLSLPRNKFLIVGKCADGFLPPSPQLIELQELEYISEMN